MRLSQSCGLQTPPDQIGRSGVVGAQVVLGEPQRVVRAHSQDRVVNAVGIAAVVARGRVVAGDRDDVAAPAIVRLPGAAAARDAWGALCDLDRPDAVAVGKADQSSRPIGDGSSSGAQRQVWGRVPVVGRPVERNPRARYSRSPRRRCWTCCCPSSRGPVGLVDPPTLLGFAAFWSVSADSPG
jgi:hypothetical protein